MQTYEEVFVAVGQEVVHALLNHHVIGEVQCSKVETVVASLVENELTRLGRPVRVRALSS